MSGSPSRYVDKRESEAIDSDVVPLRQGYGGLLLRWTQDRSEWGWEWVGVGHFAGMDAR